MCINNVHFYNRFFHQTTAISVMSSSPMLIFVTGGTGFIGFHILTHLLDNGYSVRAAARGCKVELLKKALSVNYSNDKFEVVEISDISSGDYSQHLKGVKAIIHAAAPLSGRTDPETAFRVGYLAPVRAGIQTDRDTSNTRALSRVLFMFYVRLLKLRFLEL
ncbi:hypothetical protein IW261DRAFT_568200 [Armillaria novae-zelandiae]|uniref:NAD-dependent epimerase/dehydratase domain-containing protein n=1 Tax=Armillaria novae-zelandiae TaxID=153914 RepID=A0AA39UD13_9AGAR|nr:hypothetical protein IW261DRAFT_568200 [Armillaria novae-zelandiae]